MKNCLKIPSDIMEIIMNTKMSFASGRTPGISCRFNAANRLAVLCVDASPI